jgi:hypothetical protein
MQVRAADPHGVDADLHFTGAGIGQRRVHQSKLAQPAKLGDPRRGRPASASCAADGRL